MAIKWFSAPPPVLRRPFQSERTLTHSKLFMPHEYFSMAMDDSKFNNSGDGDDDGDGDGDGPFQWVRPLSLHKNTTIKLGSAQRFCFVACIFS